MIYIVSNVLSRDLSLLKQAEMTTRGIKVDKVPAAELKSKLLALFSSWRQDDRRAVRYCVSKLAFTDIDKIDYRLSR